jgi:Fic family protein
MAQTENPQPVKIETHRSGIFTLQVGIDLERLKPLMDRVEDAHRRFSSVPILPDVAIALEKEVVVSSVFGTNTIEGATLSEKETAEVIERPLEEAKNENERRVKNLKAAYDYVEELADQSQNSNNIPAATTEVAAQISEHLIKTLQEQITTGLSHPNNTPGEYRNNQKGQLTKVGNDEHGGSYTPPKGYDDVLLVIKGFIAWINSPVICALSPLIRAPLVHYYFERTHPFWDGNGRVGRVLEAFVLKCASYKYAHFALSRYYLEHVDEYFRMFNAARKAEEAHQDYPNTVFVEFFNKGMLEVLNRVHDRANRLLADILFESRMQSMLLEKKINTRQFQLLQNLFSRGLQHNTADLRKELWYQSLYKDKTPKTRLRDLRGLEALEFIRTADRTLRLLVPGASD